MNESHFKTRFCPSPTGLIHLGNVRTALFNYLYAMHIGGTFLLRIEDTDVERSKVEFDEAMQADCHWLGLNWQEGPGADEGNGPYHQSKRQAIYDDYYKRLESTGTAYPCFCSEEQLALMRKVQRAAGKPPRYAGTCRELTSAEVEAKIAAGEKPTLRFRVPENDTVVFNDMVRGEQKFNTGDIGDFIIRRANGTAPFMYCNAIDDAMMGVTHALRGEDHLTNTPRQIMILEALGLTAPTYGHIALITSSDGSPLSKRHGSKSIQECREAGYLPQAINNYLARLGHYYKEEGFMSLAELSSAFKTESLSKSPAKFNCQQLNYWQKEAVMRLSYDEMWDWLGDDIKAMVPDDKQALFIETIQPNVIFPSEALAWVDIFIKASELTFEDDKQKAFLQEAGADYFNAAIEAYSQHAADYQPFIGHIKEKAGVKGKALFMPLRLALTGLTHGPELPKILALMEPELIKQRLQEARDGK